MSTCRKEVGEPEIFIYYLQVLEILTKPSFSLSLRRYLTTDIYYLFVDLEYTGKILHLIYGPISTLEPFSQYEV